MATQKAIESNPIKNNSGATLGEGNFSKLNTTSLGNTPTSGPSLGRFQGVSLQIQSTTLMSGIHLGGKVEDFYRTQLTQYSSKLTNINPLTNQGTRTNSTDTFVVDSTQQGNNNSAYWFHVGQPKHFNYQSLPTSSASISLYMLASEVNGASAEKSATITSGKRGVSVFTGAVNPTGNIWHEKLITVTKTESGADTSTTYSVPVWSKLNLNFGANVTNVAVSTSDDPTIGFTMGFRDSFAQATTLSRSVQLSPTKSNPATFNGDANLTLTGTEKAIRITASGTNVHQIMIKEIDGQGNKSPVVCQMVPSGVSFTYYPNYNSLAIADTLITSFWVDVLT